MNKKALTMSFVALLVGIFILIIIIWIILGPDQLLSKAKDLAFAFGYGSVPWARTPDFQGETKIPTSVETYFNNLMSALQSPLPGDNCRIELGAVPEESGYSIALFNNKAQIDSSRKGQVTLPYKSTTLQNFKPCSVDGPSTATFFDCFQNVNKESCKKPMFSEKQEIVLRKDQFAPFLLKTKDRFCFVSVYDDFLGNCNEPKDGKIDTDCYNTLRPPECGKTPPAPIVGGQDTKMTSMVNTAILPFLKKSETKPSSPLCYIVQDMSAFEKNYYLTMQSDNQKTQLKLSKFEGPTQFTVVESMEINQLLPYADVNNERGKMESLFANYPDAHSYSLIPDQYEIPLSKLTGQAEIMFDPSGRSLILVQKEGKWFLTTTKEINQLSQNDIGGRC